MANITGRNTQKSIMKETLFRQEADCMARCGYDYVRVTAEYSLMLKRTYFLGRNSTRYNYICIFLSPRLWHRLCPKNRF